MSEGTSRTRDTSSAGSLRSTTEQHQQKLQEHAGNGKLYRTDAKLSTWLRVPVEQVPAILRDLVANGVLVPAGVSKHGSEIFTLPLSPEAAELFAGITQHQPVPLARMEDEDLAGPDGGDKEPYRELKRRKLVDVRPINGSKYVVVTGEVRR